MLAECQETTATMYVPTRMYLHNCNNVCTYSFVHAYILLNAHMGAHASTDVHVHALVVRRCARAPTTTPCLLNANKPKRLHMQVQEQEEIRVRDGVHKHPCIHTFAHVIV